MRPLVSVLCLLALFVPAGGAQAAAPAGPTDTAGPTVSGKPQQGQRLVALPGTWTGSGTVTHPFQWYRCDSAGAHCSSVHGATGAGYHLVAADVGKLIGLTVRASDSTGTTSAYASLVGPVVAANATVVATTQPAITGAAVVGQVLTVANGTWSGPATAFTYAWQRCNANGRICAPITGASTSTYTSTTADAGHALVAAVTAASASGPHAAWSTATVPVKASPGPLLSVAPAVTGPLQQGQKLTATTGTWTGSGTIAYAFQWSRCDPTGAHCSSVHGATAHTYTLVAADVGKTIGLTVRATDTTGTIAGYASLVGTIAAPAATPVVTRVPAITGTAVVGQTLTVDNGAWSPTQSAYAYGWLRCNQNGRICAAITGATTATYVATAADVGHALVATVGAGSTQLSWSTATAPVGSGP